MIGLFASAPFCQTGPSVSMTVRHDSAALLARVRERIEAKYANPAKCTGLFSYRDALDDTLRAVDEVEKEERT